MYLFVNTLFPESTVLLHEGGRILARSDFSGRGREYETLFPEIERLIHGIGRDFADLAGITVVNGPGSFTGMRIVTLTVDAIAYAHPTIRMEGIDFARLGQLLGWAYPYCQKINRGEYIIAESATCAPRIVAIADMPSGDYSGVAEEKDFANRDIRVQCTSDYA